VTKPLSHEKRLKIWADLFWTEKNCHAIARRHGVWTTTVVKLALAAGICVMSRKRAITRAQNERLDEMEERRLAERRRSRAASMVEAIRSKAMAATD
jgi:hypothetical protein